MNIWEPLAHLGDDVQADAQHVKARFLAAAAANPLGPECGPFRRDTARSMTQYSLLNFDANLLSN